MLGTLDPEQKKDWKKYIPSLVYAYNCTVHETTKISPFELMFGREPKLPIDSVFQVEAETNNKTAKEYLNDLKERLKETQDIVKKVSAQSKKRQKDVYDRKAMASGLEIGDSVLVRILAFEGRHKIADKFEPDVYKVIDQPNRSIPVYVIKSSKGVVKKLHRNHLLPVGNVYDTSTKEEQNLDTEKEGQHSELSPQVKPVPRPRPIPRKRTSLNGGVAASSKPAGFSEEAYKRDTERERKECDVTDSESDSGEYVSHTYYKGDALTPSLDGDGDKEIIETDKETVHLEEGTERTEETTGDTNSDAEGEHTDEDTSDDDTNDTEAALPTFRRPERPKKLPTWMKDYHVGQQTVKGTENKDTKLTNLNRIVSSGLLDTLEPDLVQIIIQALLK
ncbi:uncharacterized protein LOC128554456 [Mercenaria mercenaria]|uniref:uncharacterized protein LOC128554456 n=1 Tax=Mercenaria mercenaria TaxID=6596 RepID=UPI00234F9FFA|nr:uncharacterized protein LOC128554456 [Mercenaria mercenaria]